MIKWDYFDAYEEVKIRGSPCQDRNNNLTMIMITSMTAQEMIMILFRT